MVLTSSTRKRNLRFFVRKLAGLLQKPIQYPMWRSIFYVNLSYSSPLVQFNSYILEMGMLQLERRLNELMQQGAVQ